MKSFLKFVIISIMGDSMDFLITLDQFEGPLDLMLHLIKENKLAPHQFHANDKILMASVGASMNINAVIYQFDK